VVAYIHLHPQLSYLSRALLLIKNHRIEKKVVIDSAPTLAGNTLNDDFLKYCNFNHISEGLDLDTTYLNSWKSFENGINQFPAASLAEMPQNYIDQIVSSARDTLIRTKNFTYSENSVVLDNHLVRERTHRLVIHYESLFRSHKISTVIISHGNYDVNVAAIAVALNTGIPVYILHAGMHFNCRLVPGWGVYDKETFDPWGICKSVLESVETKKHLKLYKEVLIQKQARCNVELLTSRSTKTFDDNGYPKKKVVKVYCHALGDASTRYTSGTTNRCYWNSWDWFCDTVNYLEDSSNVLPIVRLHPQSKNFNEIPQITRIISEANRKRRHQIGLEHPDKSSLDIQSADLIITNHGYIGLETVAKYGRYVIQAGPGSHESILECNNRKEYMTCLNNLSHISKTVLCVDPEVQGKALLRLNCEEFLRTNFLYSQEMKAFNSMYNFGVIETFNINRFYTNALALSRLYENIIEHKNGLGAVMI
jgi:hypothetical protein